MEVQNDSDDDREDEDDELVIEIGYTESDREKRQKNNIASYFSKAFTEFLVKFCQFTKFECLNMGLNGRIKISFAGEFVKQRFNEGFTIKFGSGDSKKRKFVMDSDNDDNSKRIRNESSDDISQLAAAALVSDLSSKLRSLAYSPLPPGSTRAKANFLWIARQFILNLRSIKQRAVRVAYEKYESSIYSAIDDLKLAVTSLKDFIAVLKKYLLYFRNQMNKAFRFLSESIIRRAGHMFDNKSADGLFSSLSQKINCDISIWGMLKGGIEIDIDLDASKLVGRYYILKARSAGIKHYAKWAEEIIATRVQLLHEISVENIRKRNLGSMRFGWIKKQDRNKNSMFRSLKKWQMRYLILSSETEQVVQSNAAVSGNSPSRRDSGSDVQNQSSSNYIYKLEYFRKAADKERKSTPIILTSKMWCFVDTKYENAFKIKEDLSGKGYTEGADGNGENWDTILFAICVDSNDPDYLEALDAAGESVTFESPSKSRDSWVQKINEAINLIQGKIDD